MEIDFVLYRRRKVITLRSNRNEENLGMRREEFIAHGANVTCLALGHKSGHVLVTGGDDKKVNLWAVGKPSCIISLSGHMTPIECVRFGHTENTVCAGSVAGALKVWDLEACRLMRTLTGHKSSVRCVEFHPYGDFLTSGSKDTSIKLWDIRRKGCIFTYKGHTEAVNSLKFSPDGQWIASAGQEGIVKLWDLRMGRMLREFTEHTGPVNSVEFHPHEFLLASSSQDHSINFWDLEHFSLVSTTGRESSPSRCLLFSNSGDVLFSGANDMLRVYGWEPARTIRIKPVPWGKVRDMAISLADDKVIAASFHSTNVSIWVIETSELTGSGLLASEAAEDRASPQANPFSHGNSLRKSFSKQKPSPEAKKALSVKTIEESERSETDPEDDVQPEIHNVLDYQQVFQPSRSLNRSPTISIYESPRPVTVAPSASLYKSTLPQSYREPTVNELHGHEKEVDEDDESPGDRTFTLTEPSVLSYSMPDIDSPVSKDRISDAGFGSSQPGSTSSPMLYTNPPNMANVLMDRRQSLSPPTTAPFGSTLQTHSSSTLPPSPAATRYHQRRHSVSRDPGPSAFAAHQPSADLDNEFPVKLSSIHHSSSESSVPKAASVQHQRHSTKHSRSISQSSSVPKATLRETKSDRGGQLLSSPSISPPRTPEEEFIPMSAPHPAGLNFEDFLPKSYKQRLSYTQGLPHKSEAEVFTTIFGSHDHIMSILDDRVRRLHQIHTLWQTKDLKAAVETAVNLDDNNGVVVDFLSAITPRPNIWNLDICVAVLPTISELLQSKYETHMRAGCDALRLIVRNFSPLIKSNVLSGSAGFGVDIPREERYQKCVKCYNILVSIRAFLLKRQTLQGPMGQAFRELHVSLQEIDAK
uniref:Katanin p80 WD40 repeat-containing subunit B1 n=1 Tax=Lygus hesperus TaxID=30085 RepID=A0A146LI69_LYGHE